MVRNSFALKLHPQKLYQFGQTLKENWSDLTSKFDELDVSNFSMWLAEDLIFGYFETPIEMDDWDEETKIFFKSINKSFDGCYDWISRPFVPMRLMYQDFGVVREDKELIRHRVFMTKLNGDFEEEYKRRHDALIDARNGVISPGPDSNFSIWSAGGYIFGYDEIDTTMEKDRTEADRQADIKWETKMLEIMTWITDDVDWITGMHHPHIKRLCYHN